MQTSKFRFLQLLSFKIQFKNSKKSVFPTELKKLKTEVSERFGFFVPSPPGFFKTSKNEIEKETKENVSALLLALYFL